MMPSTRACWKISNCAVKSFVLSRCDCVATGAMPRCVSAAFTAPIPLWPNAVLT